MTRIVKHTYQDPYKLAIGGGEKYICRCGLSRNQPFCDGSHKLTGGEDQNKLYWYDAGGQRHECADAFTGIRTY